jgi:DNA replicative helicase MCM subunit Mcm2 (Cdc46/Mcm family)
MLEFGNRSLRMDWAGDARELWCEAYEILTADRPGMFGAVTARAEAQTLRLSMLYALADYSDEIHEEHVQSALAVWEYCEESARVIFGDTGGDPDADKVLAELNEGPDGLTRTEIRDIFSRNKGTEELDRIRDTLVTAGRITRETRGDDRKSHEVWRAV